MEKLNEVKRALRYLELDAKDHADNFSVNMIVSTKTILAIAETFRALEQMQMQQAAEVGKANALIDDLRQERDILQRIAGERGNKLEAAEEKLAGLENQEPVAWGDLQHLKKFGYCAAFEDKSHVMGESTELFTRPAPAVNLMSLLPREQEMMDGPAGWDAAESHAWAAGANWMRAAILRKIEEPK